VTSADPQPAQALRVNFVPAPNVARELPRRRAAGRGAAARRARAHLRATDRRRRAARGLGLVEGARAPAPDLPRGRRRGARAGARQGPRGAQGAAAAEVRRRRWPRSPPTVRLARTGQTAWTFGTIESRSRSAAPATRCAASRRSSTRARRSGWGLRLRRRAGGAAPARRTPAAAARGPDPPVNGCSTASTTPRSSRSPARRTRRSPSCSTTCARRSRARSSTPGPPVRDEAAYDAWWPPLAGRDDERRARRRPRRRDAGARRLAHHGEGAQRAAPTCHAAALTDMRPSWRGWCTGLRRRGRGRRLRRYPTLPRRARAPPRASSTRRSTATAS
jgi:hypothetical protein